MAKRELIVRLEDILYRIKRIEEIIASVISIENLSSNPMFSDALERNFEVIGEALYQVRKERPRIPITGRDKIIALRHIIAHDCYDVDPKLLWSTAVKYLPLLK